MNAFLRSTVHWWRISIVHWWRISIEVVVLMVVVATVIAVQLLYKSPIPYDGKIQPPISCQKSAPSLNGSGIGMVYTKTSFSDASGEFVGLSDGVVAFNTLGPDAVLKCLASQDLRQGHPKEAEQHWIQALQRQSNDAEVQIYKENQRVLESTHSYVIFVVGVVLTGPTAAISAINNGQDILQGTYTAQKSYNQSHANGPQIRLLLANFGSDPTFTAKVAQQIVTAATGDRNIIGMTSLPAIANKPTILGTLQQANLPLVLPSGSTGSQEEQTNIFHIAASTKEQGTRAAQYVEQDCPNSSSSNNLPAFDCRKPNVAVFIDYKDSYSYSMGQAFINRLKQDNANNQTKKNVAPPKRYNVGDPSSIKAAVVALGDVVPDLIYFAGNAADAGTLLENLPQTGAFADLRVLGGDALYQPGSYKADTYRRLNITAFAYPDEWDTYKAKEKPPAFFCDYAKAFAGGTVKAPTCDYDITTTGRAGYGYNRPENDVILAYDALSIILIAFDKHSNDSIPIRDQLLNTIGKVTFEGVSGNIAFDPDGNPKDKAILILRVDRIGQTTLQGKYGTF